MEIMTVLAKSLIAFGILTFVDGREPLKAHDSLQNERELSSTENDRDHWERLNEKTKKRSNLNEDHSLGVRSGCLQQAYDSCQAEELAKLIGNPRPKRVCPPNFTHISSSNKCYKLEFDQMDWKDARIRCKNLHRDAHLVVVDDAAEQTAIVTYLTSLKARITSQCHEGSLVKVWTAAQRIDPSRNSMFMWKPFDSMVEMKYTNWMPGEPNFSGSKESCVHFYTFPDLKWNDVICSASDNVYGAGKFFYNQCPLCEIDL